MLCLHEILNRVKLHYATLKSSILILVIAAFALPAFAQTEPEKSEKVPIGTIINAPCSCEGNACTLWPLPDGNFFPQGFVYRKKTVQSHLTKGYMDKLDWVIEKTIGGAYVDTPKNGGKCIQEDTGKPAPANYSITEPGTYRLQILTKSVTAYYNCRNTICAAPTTVDAPDTEANERYYTVGSPKPQKECKSNIILNVTDPFMRPLDKATLKSLGLEGPVMRQGQTVDVPDDSIGVWIYFGDGKVTRLFAGTHATFNLCPDEGSAK